MVPVPFNDCQHAEALNLSLPPMPKGPRHTGRAGVRDVARIARVAPITVSRALRTPELVAKATREQIQRAIEATGYIPNLVAGSLSSNRTKLIGAIIATLRNSMATQILEEMSAVLHGHGYHLLVGSSGFSIAEEEALVAAFLARRADALYLTGQTHSARTRKLLKLARIPVVEVATLPRRPIDTAVGFSNENAGYTMTAWLIARGYRNIAFFSAPTRHNDRQTDRLAGYRRALQEAGHRYNPAMVAEMPIDLECSKENLLGLLQREPGVDALFCGSDVLAIGALLECERQGIVVPDRLAIAGFDDLDMARHVTPALTTVRIPSREIGRGAAEMLLARLMGRRPNSRIVDLGFEIVPRQSA
jgi:LacI family gluconate utilization system Gnt-I transcriptional repressor